jgi:hypothetical protein
MQYQPATDSHPSGGRQPPDGPACQVCGATPAAEVKVRQHVGMIILWMNRSFRSVLCRDCAIALFREKQDDTLLTGWWGMASLVINTGTIIYNLAQRRFMAKMPAPVRPAGRIPMHIGRPVFLRPGFFVPVGTVVIMLGVILLSIVTTPR